MRRPKVNGRNNPSTVFHEMVWELILVLMFRKYVWQEKLKELQFELDVVKSKIKNNEKLTEKDIKFVGELGWLSAATIAIARIAGTCA
jgi:hypothetical protein